jgi:hypothetical protein
MNIHQVSLNSQPIILYCGARDEHYMDVSNWAFHHGWRFEHAPGLRQLSQMQTIDFPGKRLAIIDIDSLGGPAGTVDALIGFRQATPSLPTVLLSTEFASPDYGMHRISIGDCSINSTKSVTQLNSATELAFLHNRIWSEKLHGDSMRAERVEDEKAPALLSALILAAFGALATGIWTLIATDSWALAGAAYTFTALACLVAVPLIPAFLALLSKLRSKANQ